MVGLLPVLVVRFSLLLVVNRSPRLRASRLPFGQLLSVSLGSPSLGASWVMVACIARGVADRRGR
ncbi:MAG: hypothetical protein ACK5QX_00975 [bacterium]